MTSAGVRTFSPTFSKDDVIKIEPPGGDRLRAREPFWPGETGPEASALFAYVNAGKRSITLDPDAPADRDRLHAPPVSQSENPAPSAP
jgi:hypothetical protein